MASDQIHLQEVIDYDPERRKRFVDLKSEDIARIAAIKNAVAGHAEEHAAAFFNYLSQFEEAAPLFRNSDLLREARRLKHEHLLAMASGEYGRNYVEQRVKLGALYGKLGIDARVFLGAFNQLLQSIDRRIVEMFPKDAQAAAQHFSSLCKVGFFDIGIIVDVLIAERERTIGFQEKAILELSTPALQIRDRLLMLPIIGLLDSLRAKQLTDGLLPAWRRWIPRSPTISSRR
jgi:rsbT co-antagonist protein RsbR